MKQNEERKKEIRGKKERKKGGIKGIKRDYENGSDGVTEGGMDMETEYELPVLALNRREKQIDG